MRIPKTLKIGGHTVKVEIKKLENDCGFYDNRRGLIVIDSEMPRTLKESTLLHEIIHVLNSTLSEKEIGHMFQDSLAEQLYQVLSENGFLK